MSGMNSSIHLKLATETLERLQKESLKQDCSVSELIRNKLEEPAKPKEIIVLRELIKLISCKKENKK